MNRRSFILHSAAGVALLGTSAAAQRGSTTSTVLVSKVTGAEIDFTQSGFILEHQEINPFFSSEGLLYENEHIHFMTESGKLEIELLASGLYSWQEDMSDFLADYKLEYDVEEHAYEDLADGGYSAASFDTLAVYHEYQLGAFPDVDMRVILNTEQVAFHDELALAQTILVGGAAPFLYTAESKVADIDFADSAQTTTGTPSTRSTRTGTGSQAATTSASNTAETSGSGSTSSGAGGDSEYVEIIVVHRETFLASYDLFMGHLAVVGEETTSDLEKADLFEQMYNIALEWKAYPDDAMAPAVPSSLTELSTLYVEWALVIGDMGSLFEELYNGVDTIDAFIAAMSEWELLDAQLEVALQEFGSRGFTRASGAIASIRNGLQVAWRSMH